MTAAPRRWRDAAAAITRDTVQRTRQRDLMLVSAGLTFYAGIAVVPLLLSGLYGAGLLIGPQRVTQLVAQLSAYVPPELGTRALVRMLGDMGPELGIPALLASVLTASTYGEGVLRAFAQLEQPRGAPATAPPRTTLRGRLLVVPYLLCFPLVIVAGLEAVALLPETLGTGTGGRLLGVYLTFWAGWISAAALLVVLYRVFSGRRTGGGDRRLRWPAVGWAALAAGSCMSGTTLGWALLLRFGVTVGQAFGGSEQLGRVVLVAIYLLLIQVTLLVGYVAALVIDARDSDTPGGDAPGGDTRRISGRGGRSGRARDRR